MLKTLLYVIALLAVALTGSAGAQAPEQDYVELQRKGMTDEPTVGSRHALLAAVATWISREFDLPPIDRLPQIVLVSPDRISAMRYQRILPGPAAAPPPTMTAERQTVALYSDAAHTIYLPRGWKGDTPAESSVLVHEVVHHFQNVLGIGYECPQAREKLAYLAQSRWLAQFARSLEQDFDIDPLTLLVTTKCFH
jgi:hypothetical protein